MVLKSLEIAKTANNFIKKRWSNFWKASAISSETKVDKKNYNKLITIHQEQMTMNRFIDKALKESISMRLILEKPVNEIIEKYESIMNENFQNSLKEYEKVVLKLQEKEKQMALKFQREIIMKLDNMLQDSSEMIRKVETCFLNHKEMEKIIISLSPEDADFRINYQKQNEKILSKETANFNKSTDKNVTKILQTFSEICEEIKCKNKV